MAMTRNDVIRNVDNALRTDPYAMSLSDYMGRMTSEQLAYFCDRVAPYYMEGPGKTPYGGEYKNMEYLARVVMQNKDVSGLLGIDYTQISKYLNQLPELQYPVYISSQSQQFYSAVRTDVDRIAHINEMIDKYVLHVGESKQGLQNSTFCQTANVVQTQLPTQGWKFHISANGLEDYERLLEIMLPEFDRLGVAYKVTKPSELDRLNAGQQVGKAITIYPTPAFDINRFSPELRNILEEDGLHPIGDAQIVGRIHARYGKFRGANTHDLSAPDGKVIPDQRHSVICPDFVSERYTGQILGFYSDCIQRYNETGDYKRYLQETATMTATDGRSNAYMILELKDGYGRQLQKAVDMDPQGMSYVYEINGQSYAMIHNTYVNQCVNNMVQMELNPNYFRPDWDRRFNVYAVHPDDVNHAIQMVDEYNFGRDTVNGAPELSCMYLEDGTIGIKVDTCLNRDFESQCISHSIRIRDEQINHSEFGLNQQASQQYWQSSGGSLSQTYDDALIIGC